MRTAEQIMASVLDEMKHDARSPEDLERLVTMQKCWDVLRERRDRLHLTILLAEETLRVEDERFATTFDEMTG
jgi:hypothetical protein